MNNVIRARSDVYDLAEQGQNRKSKARNTFSQQHGKLISIVTCSVIFSTVVLFAIIYGTDILSCKMKAIKMVKSRHGSKTSEEHPRYTIDSHPHRHRFLFYPEVVLKSTQEGRSKWLSIEFCKNQTLERIRISGYKGDSDPTGHEILAYVSSAKINEKRNNEYENSHGAKISCTTVAQNNTTFSLECKVRSKGGFLTLQVKKGSNPEIHEVEVFFTKTLVCNQPECI
jgi:hypothetical protein